MINSILTCLTALKMACNIAIPLWKILFSWISPIHLIYHEAQFLNAFGKINLIVLKDETSLQLKINAYTYFFYGRTLRNGKRHIEKREITLYSQKTESRNTDFKSNKYGFFLKTNGLTHFFKVICYAKSENQCLQAEKWRLIELICMFLRWPPKSYIILHCCWFIV